MARPEQCHPPAGSRRPPPRRVLPSRSPGLEWGRACSDTPRETMLWVVLCLALALNGPCSSCPVAASQADNASFVPPDEAPLLVAERQRPWSARSKRQASLGAPTGDRLHQHYQQHQQVVVNDDYDDRTLVQTRNGLVRGIRKQALNETVDVYLGVSTPGDISTRFTCRNAGKFRFTRSTGQS